MLVVAKIGTSSVTSPSGDVAEAAIGKLCGEIAAAADGGHKVVVVTSGAIAAGLTPTGFAGTRPSDTETLQAVASVGQPRLMMVYGRELDRHSLIAGQVLLAPYDFSERSQYLHARQTITRLLELGVVPVVNENDATADDEIRFGDNDRLSALVAHMIDADLLLLLTDTAGLYTADPRFDAQASLVEEVVEIDQALEAAAGGPGTVGGSGGMASKLAAAKIAAFSGVRTVIADAKRPQVLSDAIAGVKGVGTVVQAGSRKLSARKLWLAFAVGARGTITVDSGARRAVVDSGTSLLPAGVRSVAGEFGAGDVVEIAEEGGSVFAKGVSRHSSRTAAATAGLRSGDLPADVPHEVVHRDDLVVLSD